MKHCSFSGVSSYCLVVSWFMFTWFLACSPRSTPMKAYICCGAECASSIAAKGHFSFLHLVHVRYLVDFTTLDFP